MAGRAAGADGLHCPGCGSPYPAQERFCADCGLPLVRRDASSGVLDAVGKRHERARKVKPQLTEGPLVRVVGAQNQAEAEFIQGLLLEEGVPSMLRRSAGFDVPDFLAAGPRDVLVPESALVTAREVLMEGELISGEPVGRPVSPGRLLAGLMVALLVGALLVWLLSRIVG